MEASDYRAAARKVLDYNQRSAAQATGVCLLFFLFLHYIFLITLPLRFAFIVAFYDFAKGNYYDSIIANIFSIIKAKYLKGLLGMLLKKAILSLITIPAITIFYFFDMTTISAIFNEGNTMHNFFLIVVPIVFTSILVLIYTYRVCLFPILLANNPEMSVYRSFRCSAEIMSGHKWQLFCLDVSFIGWFILGTIFFWTGFGLFGWTIPYYQTARSHFYIDMLKGTQFEKEDTTENPLEGYATVPLSSAESHRAPQFR